LSIQLLGCTNEDKSIIEHNIIVIKSLGRLANIEILNNDHELIDNAFTGIFGSIKISIPMDGLIDIKEEKLRIERKIKKLGEEISKREIKLRNESFLKNAPVEVVKKEKDIAKNLKSDLDKLNYQLNKIS